MLNGDVPEQWDKWVKSRHACPLVRGKDHYVVPKAERPRK
jgi:hypothetical protein